MKINRAWAMPNSETFLVKPITEFVQRWLYSEGTETADPFARNTTFAKYRNDLNPSTTAEDHLDAEEFMNLFYPNCLDAVLFDPPYSPRQISECYQSIGKTCGTKETQNAALYKRVRDAIDKALRCNGLVLSFGWNSNGMGKTRGYEIEEILLVAHGGAHNDTICMVERKL